MSDHCIECGAPLRDIRGKAKMTENFICENKACTNYDKGVAFSREAFEDMKESFLRRIDRPATPNMGTEPSLEDRVARLEDRVEHIIARLDQHDH